MSTCKGLYRLGPSHIPKDIAAFLKGKNRVNQVKNDYVVCQDSWNVGL